MCPVMPDTVCLDESEAFVFEVPQQSLKEVGTGTGDDVKYGQAAEFLASVLEKLHGANVRVGNLSLHVRDEGGVIDTLQEFLETVSRRRSGPGINRRGCLFHFLLKRLVCARRG